MKASTRRALSAAISVVVVPLVALLAWPQAALADTLSASFAKTSQWDSGFVGEYTIRNGGTTPVNGWRVEFDLPSTATVTNSWNGFLGVSGTHYTATNETWNGTLAPGASATFGFQVSVPNPATTPTGCLVNGSSCAGGGGSSTTTTTKPSTTTTTKPPTTTTTTKPPGTTTTTKPPVTTTTTTTVPPPPPGGSNGPAFAPYVDATLWPPTDLTDAAAASGVKAFTLGFVVNGDQSGSCNASWGGYYSLADNFLVDEVAQLRSQGGDVIVSFGGAANRELALTCTSVDALVNQYQAVIDKYGLTSIDFDVEGSASADAASIARRSQAIATLQARARTAGKKLNVSLTLPVLPSGLTADGINVVRSARDNSAAISVVNVMAMDYGDYSAPNPAGKMGQYAIDSANSLFGQLRTLYPSASDAALWKMVGITPMIGTNDVAPEVFTTTDAQQVTDFANQRHIGRIAMWSVNRDSQCSGGVESWPENTCSGVLQQPWQFSKTFNRFAG